MIPGELCGCIWCDDWEHPEIDHGGGVACGCGGHRINRFKQDAVHWEGKHWTLWCALQEAMRRLQNRPAVVTP